MKQSLSEQFSRGHDFLLVVSCLFAMIFSVLTQETGTVWIYKAQKLSA